MQNLNQQGLLLQAQSAMAAKDWNKAERICEILLATNKKNPTILALMAKVLTSRSRHSEAIHTLQKCTELEPKNVDHLVALARVYAQVGQSRRAISALEKAKRLAPGNASVVVGLADAFEKGGEKDKALAVLEPYIGRDQETILMAFIHAKIKLSEKKADEAVHSLLRHVNGPLYPPSFFFVLGKAFEQLDRVEEAFQAYCTANMQPHAKFDLDAHIREIDQLIKCFDATAVSRMPRATHDTSKLVFIVGRPRSGTTLLETILDSHPLITGIGEDASITHTIRQMGIEIGSTLMYPDCIRDLDQDDVDRLSSRYVEHAVKLAPRAHRIVDKSLGNYQNLGLIQLLFPSAKIINARRNPVDNCWACFVENLTYNHGYASDFRNLGVHYRQYERLMRHWHRVLDLPILDVDYESVVADQEGMSRKVIEFLGLPWDDSCLRFFEKKGEAKSANAAITLSYDQVRKPIYKTSVGRANKFEKFLQPIHDALAEGQAMVDAANERDLQFAARRDAQPAKV